jgi:O-antigen ligase
MVEILQAGRRGKLLLALVLVILFVGLYATLTRSVWLGGIGAMAMVAMVHAPRWVRVLGLAFVVLFAAASVLGVKDQLMRMKRDRNLTAADAERSVKLRPLLAVVAWEMFKDRPLTGHGFGRYDESKHRFHTDRSYGLPLEEARDYVQHNVFLSVLVDTGLIGLGLVLSWLIMLGGVAWTMARNVRTGPESRFVGMLLLGTLVAYVANGMFHDVLIIPMVHMFVFFLGGCAVTVYQNGVARTEQSIRTARAVGAEVSLQT